MQLICRPNLPAFFTLKAHIVCICIQDWNTCSTCIDQVNTDSTPFYDVSDIYGASKNKFAQYTKNVLLKHNTASVYFKMLHTLWKGTSENTTLFFYLWYAHLLSIPK